MKKSHVLKIVALVLMLSARAVAQDAVVPATSEDLSAFDRALSLQQKNAPKKTESKDSLQDSIGEAISSKAKEIKGQIRAEGFKNFGQSVADQRRNKGGKSLTAGGNSSDKSASANRSNNGKRPDKGRGNSAN